MPPIPDPKAFQRSRHARYFENGTVYHVIVRTTQGFYLLKPDAKSRLRRVIAGILARARTTFSGVKNHATVFLSNHGHLMISGESSQLAAYIGFVKRELSRRWGPVVRWHGIFEDGYHATAVLTAAAQRRCLKYIVSQGVKEGLVEDPRQWPGFHCAESLVSGADVDGEWFDGTRFGTAFHRAKRRGKERDVRRADYLESCRFAFDRPPYLEEALESDVRAEMRAIVEEVVAEARLARGSRCVVGTSAIVSMDTMTRRELPPPPWFTERRRMVVWDAPNAGEVARYIERYWEFQAAFRVAADRWARGELGVEFPVGSYRPGLARPIAHRCAAA